MVGGRKVEGRMLPTKINVVVLVCLEDGLWWVFGVSLTHPQNNSCGIYSLKNFSSSSRHTSHLLPPLSCCFIVVIIKGISLSAFYPEIFICNQMEAKISRLG